MTAPPIWPAVLTGHTRQAALSVVGQVVPRLRDPAAVQALAVAATPDWRPGGLADGYSGIALLFGQLDHCFPDRGWDREAHTYLTLAAQALEVPTPDNFLLSLWGGLSGLCYTTHFLSRGATRYRPLLATLDARLVQGLTAQLARSTLTANNLDAADCDLLDGPAGVLVYLLERPAAPALTALRDALLDWLIARCIEPGTFIPPAYQARPRPPARYPPWATTCGLGYGRSGPLAVLALARQQGIARPGLEHAVRVLADPVLAQHYEAARELHWPVTVASGGMECRSSPGVVRSLWLAGMALADPALCFAALKRLDALRHHLSAAQDRGRPILGQGRAGLLQMVLRFAADTGRSDLAAWAADLVMLLLEQFDPTAPLGFQDRQPDGHRRDCPGLWEGAAGVLLPLLAATTATPPTWDRLLLLA